ncbi:MAG: ion transporter [Solirubrobacterales bacterium]
MRPGKTAVLKQSCASMVAWAKKTSEAQWFDWLTVGVILANAVVLGLETFPSLDAKYDDLLTLLNEVFFGYYVVELAIRITAFGKRPLSFFKSGWNDFDFVIVAVGFVPGLRENATLIRMVRLLRVTRLFRLLPDLRVIVHAVGKSIPGLSSLALASLMLVYVYAMVGWVIFAEGDPKQFGNVGEAMLTMFQVLTLEGLPEFIAKGREVSDWAVPFYVSYVLLASFLVFNLFIGIVLNSMEEARAEELRRAEAELADENHKISDQEAARMAIHERMNQVREHLDQIDSDLDALRRIEEEAGKA